MNPNIVNSGFPSPIGEGSAEIPIVKNYAGVRSDDTSTSSVANRTYKSATQVTMLRELKLGNKKKSNNL